MQSAEKILLACLTMCFCLLWESVPSNAATGGKPTVSWSAYVLAMDDNNPLLDVPGVRERIRQAITKKLHVLDAEGKLPFILKEQNMDFGSIHSIDADDPIGLIPLSTLDKSFDTRYNVNGQEYYRSIVFSGLSIAICSADPEQNSWRILGTIPLNGYDVIGADLHHLVNRPITLQEKANKFAEITVRLINEHLDFTQDKKMMRDIETKALLPDTYQVTDVTLSSPGARKLFAGREQFIKDVIGAFFTSSYQQKTRRIVYPPQSNGAKWKRDVTTNLYTFQANTPSGEVTFTMEAPRHAIKLDFSGVAAHEFSTGKTQNAITRDILYKAWLKKSPLEGREQEELSDQTIRREIKATNSGSWIEYDRADVFTELVIDIANKLGAQKR